MATQVAADALGEEWKVIWSESVAGKANSFSMKQGVLFHGRVHLALLLEMKEN